MSSSDSDLRPTAGLLLTPERWRAAEQAHRERIAVRTDPLVDLHDEGVRHPVHDFLFSYYRTTPSALQRWHPGVGTALLAGPESDDAPAVLQTPGREGARFYRALSPAQAPPSGGWSLDAAAYAADRAGLIAYVRLLLSRTRQRPARLGCFGLHEWAMAYRSDLHGVRHSTLPLRLGAAGTDEVVESQRITCTHFDAFRFYAPEAAPLNAFQPTRETMPDLEQPGCLHTNMDLYKWSSKLAPAVGSDLVADCFELAWEIREMDMQASPYDLSAWGHAPIRIETAAGRAEYARLQRGFAERSAVLRDRLLAALDRLDDAAHPSQDIPTGPMTQPATGSPVETGDLP